MWIVSEGVTEQLVCIEDAIGAMALTFQELANGRATLVPALLSVGVVPGSRIGVKMALDLAARSPGLKIGTYSPGNRAIGLPNHGSTTLLYDGDRGRPSAIIASAYLTGLRTAATDAVAVDALAPAGTARLGILGAGRQALHDLQAIASVRPLEFVQIWSRSEPAAEALAAQARDMGINARSARLETAVRDASILCTVTAAREALFPADWVQPGTHVSAMGADGPGKQELDPALTTRARLFADWPEQSIRLGEFQAAYREGLIGEAAITSLGDVLTGVAVGRSASDDITVFDSSGIALQDIAIAKLALARAQRSGLALSLEFSEQGA
jgi:alanine dehydrogenase